MSPILVKVALSKSPNSVQASSKLLHPSLLCPSKPPISIKCRKSLHPMYPISVKIAPSLSKSLRCSHNNSVQMSKIAPSDVFNLRQSRSVKVTYVRLVAYLGRNRSVKVSYILPSRLTPSKWLRRSQNHCVQVSYLR